MKYLPYQFNSGDVQIVTEELLTGSSPQNLALNRTNVRLAVDFDVRQANRQMHKYVGVAKARKNNSGNLSGLGQIVSQPWSSTASTNVYHSGKTLISSQFRGNPINVANGMVYVVYYIWFKGQRIDV